MNILVCIKSVPATTKVSLDPVTHTLIRDGRQSVINPFDLSALEEALCIRECLGDPVVGVCDVLFTDGLLVGGSAGIIVRAVSAEFEGEGVDVHAVFSQSDQRFLDGFFIDRADDQVGNTHGLEVFQLRDLRRDVTVCGFTSDLHSGCFCLIFDQIAELYVERSSERRHGDGEITAFGLAVRVVVDILRIDFNDRFRFRSVGRLFAGSAGSQRQDHQQAEQQE